MTRAALLLLSLVLAAPVRAASPAPIERSQELDALVARVAGDVAAEFASAGLAPEGISISVIDLKGTGPLPSGSYRGDVPHYPASVVKAFYLAYYVVGKEAGRLRDTPELARAVKDMIVVSSNDATGLVVDAITDTTSGPEIASARRFEKWKKKRNAVNRFFSERGYRDVNVNQKTFCEDAYGREQAFRDQGKNRNRVSSDAAARLFKEIALGEMAGPAGTKEMLALLERDVTPEKSFEEGELEDARLSGRTLPAGTRFWSKSGEAYDSHHLVARVLLPSGRDFVIAAFTKGARGVQQVLPRIYEKVGAHFAGTNRGQTPISGSVVLPPEVLVEIGVCPQ